MHIYVGLARLCPLDPFHMETTTHGVLELLLVSAVGMNHAHHHLGPQRYYVTIQCGDQFCTRGSGGTRSSGSRCRPASAGSWPRSRSRSWRGTSSPRTLWSAKSGTSYVQETPSTVPRSDDLVQVRCRVHVGEIIREGSEREFLQMKPAPYNIVLRDGTYKGELKLGLKFLSGVSSEQRPGERRQCAAAPPRRPYAVYTPFLNITLPCVPWRRFFFFCTRSNRWTTRE
ncbi:uncharacterized protein LOC125516834 [Triticum urartu]|uniref:uncharacterized protein LOC125516834 n=1 Tax=Triticum urartu TaxID=4572 RepID=UPI002043F96D|nr:uncharacterized protein LOC125516834 [Triticum urartu]